ncbi:MAG TPA: hypothetical protein VGX48_17355 [Pyrinomonadaceae bacterium]|jgi:hypothetical protein|nr:hypothetical protein [Pyrinomonadaceae bacterium]
MTRAALHVLIVCAALAVMATQARAQTQPAPQRSKDEDFELNITERRIVETDLYAGTELAAGDARGRGLDLRVGVMVRAGSIEVLLREVHGRVRFRADLGPLLRLLDARRANSQAPPATTPSAPPK